MTAVMAIELSEKMLAAAAGWPGDDGGEFLDNYLRVTRRAKVVVSKVFGG